MRLQRCSDCLHRQGILIVILSLLGCIGHTFSQQVGGGNYPVGGGGYPGLFQPPFGRPPPFNVPPNFQRSPYGGAPPPYGGQPPYGSRTGYAPPTYPPNGQQPPPSSYGSNMIPQSPPQPSNNLPVAANPVQQPDNYVSEMYNGPVHQCYVCSGQYPDQECQLHPEKVDRGPGKMDCTKDFCTTHVRYTVSDSLLTEDEYGERTVTNRPLSPADFKVQSIARECEALDRGNTCERDGDGLSFTCYHTCTDDLCNDEVPAPALEDMVLGGEGMSNGKTRAPITTRKQNELRTRMVETSTKRDTLPRGSNFTKAPPRTRPATRKPGSNQGGKPRGKDENDVLNNKGGQRPQKAGSNQQLQRSGADSHPVGHATLLFIFTFFNACRHFL